MYCMMRFDSLQGDVPPPSSGQHCILSSLYPFTSANTYRQVQPNAVREKVIYSTTTERNHYCFINILFERYPLTCFLSQHILIISPCIWFCFCLFFSFHNNFTVIITLLPMRSSDFYFYVINKLANCTIGVAIVISRR